MCWSHRYDPHHEVEDDGCDFASTVHDQGPPGVTSLIAINKFANGASKYPAIRGLQLMRLLGV